MLSLPLRALPHPISSGAPSRREPLKSSPPLCLIHAVCFFTGRRGAAPYGAEQNIICRGGFHILPYYVRSIFRLCTNERLPTISVGGDVPDAPQRCSHYLTASTDVRTYQEPSPVGEGGSRRLTDEVSVSLFAPSFGFAQTNENHLIPCRDRRPRLSVSLFA